MADDVDKTEKTPGEVAYDTYVKVRQVDGVYAWDDLILLDQLAWESAAQAVKIAEARIAMDVNRQVQAVAFVALCKEWFGVGTTGNEGVLTASGLAGESVRREEFAELWKRAGVLAGEAKP